MTKGPRLDWRQLQCFRLVARMQHITRAAAELGTSQPSLSRTLARMEADLGVPLFMRAGRKLTLTRHGALFLERVERACRDIDEGIAELSDLANPSGGRIALGFLRTLGFEYVPQTVRAFGLRYPNVRFTFRPGRSAALNEQLMQGELDLIVSAIPAGVSPFSWAHVQDQELILIVSPSHRLAKRREVALREVADDPFIAFRSGAIRSLTDELCAASGFVPKIVFEGEDSSSVPGFVAAGFAVAVVPPEGGRFGGVVGLRISEPSSRRAIGIGWIADRYLPASARTFRDFAVDAARVAPKR